MPEHADLRTLDPRARADRRTRYVVIGAGAIGALLAAQLELAGIDGVLVARGRNLEAIRAGGVRVRRPTGVEVVPVRVVGGPEELVLTVDDVLVLATKAQDADDVLRQWAWLPVTDDAGAPTRLAADLPVLTFQNGLATEDLALRRFRRVYGASIAVAASHLVPGEVVSPSWPVIGLVWLGRYGDRADAAQAGYVRDLTLAGYDVVGVPGVAAGDGGWVGDIRAWKARRLIAGVANGLDVLTGSVAQKTQARALLEAETRAVYAAAGLRLPDDAHPAARRTLRIQPVAGHTGGRLSTWQSFARGDSSEVDYLNGEIVRLGRQFGVATPVNEQLQRLLGAQAASGAGPGVYALSELLVAARPVVPVRPLVPRSPMSVPVSG